MKKFTKLFLTCAAVAGLAAAMGTTAMAASVTGDLTGTYDETAGTLTLDTITAGTGTTVLVLDADAKEEAVTADDILYIDQVDDGAFGTMGLLLPESGKLADGKYTVKVGYYNSSNEFAILSGTFQIGETASTVLIGDVTGEGDITLGDATAIVQHYVGNEEITGETALAAAAGADGNDGITLGDAVCIVQYYVGNTNGAGAVGTYQ